VFPEEEDYFFGVSGGPSFYQKQRLASAQLSMITLEKEKTEVPTLVAKKIQLAKIIALLQFL
jgi:hypothetical protein